ncbi:hypothetical protein G7Y89_g13878 [Cudoniella acicularis]|uniref:Uncharacterized protein n=1 Tax=Cudoniella acicularis TaxID=354080 RepID=A0A8H4R8P0_9HELO|nr:hypothetical protein G7Y89_g13878 [Cudoniella acicularis]
MGEIVARIVMGLEDEDILRQNSHGRLMADPNANPNGPYSDEMSMAALPDSSPYYGHQQMNGSSYPPQSQGGKNGFAQGYQSPNPPFQPQYYGFPGPSPPMLKASRTYPGNFQGGNSYSVPSQNGNVYAPEKAHGGGFDPGRMSTGNTLPGVLPQSQRTGAGPKRHGGSFDPNQGYPSRSSRAQTAIFPQSPGVSGRGQYPPQRAQTVQWQGSTSYPGIPSTNTQQKPSGAPAKSHGGSYNPATGPRNNYGPTANGGQYDSRLFATRTPVSYPTVHTTIPSGKPANDYLPQLLPVHAQPTPHNEPTLGALRFGEREGIADTVSGQNTTQRRTPQKGYANFLDWNALLRWKYPNIFQMPGIPFRSTNQGRHRDIMQRVWRGPEEDRYLSPYDGHLAKLIVQVTQEIYESAPNSTYRRTFVRNISPAYVHAANFPFSAASTDIEHWDENDWGMVVIKWIPACVVLVCVLAWNPNGAEGEIRNHGRYDPFPYRFWGYPKAARNLREGQNPPPSGPNSSGLLQRVLGPRWLCVLKPTDPEHPERMCGMEIQRVDESSPQIDYLFIGYTTQQFDNEDFDSDMPELHAIAERAAREANVGAFWVAGSCMRDTEDQQEDVYRINDIVRSAHSLVIIVGPANSRPEVTTREDMLRMWGERVWTLPELLLSNTDPNTDKIKVYTRGVQDPPEEISKKHFAGIVWNDPLISRQLVDHYNKTLELSRLELVSIALRCLANREKGDYLPGDLAYALMGLLRQRPAIDPTDTLFQAFARLSMANDTDMLLERLICMLPKNANSPWVEMDDAWDCNLWDIYPGCQVAGICNDDTVLLDEHRGGRLGARTLLHASPGYFLTGIILVSLGNLYNFFVYQAFGGILLALGLAVILASPYLVRVIYGGKLWGTQAWFFGFEGYMDLATIETHIFGAYMGRLKWSPTGSTLSRHVANTEGECVGIDPTTDPAVQALVNNAVKGPMGGPKVFTLVDTYTLTVTMFTAVRPPVAVILCGREGGMQRALMCSYHWQSQTLYRESVLRMETPILEKMFRVHRFRFGLQRPPPNI